MPYSIIKTESYANVGGINVKSSPYVTGLFEFLNLSNFDFQQPGSLSQRWGTTLYMSQSFTAAISALYEFSRLDGFSGLVVGTTGALWFGATTGTAQGISFTQAGITTGFEPQISAISFAAGSIIEAVGSQAKLEGDESKILFQNGSTIPFYVLPQTQESNRLDFVTFQNYLFGADGSKFFKYDGVTTSFVGLPPAVRKNSPTIAGDSSFGFNTNGTYIALFASYVNKRGFEGPAWLIGAIEPIAGATVNSVKGASLLKPTYTFATPLQYDIDKVKIYAYSSSSTLLVNSASTWSVPYRFLMSVTASGSTITTATVGITNGTIADINIGAEPPLATYMPLGFTIQVPANSRYVSEIDVNNYSPKYLEIFQNRLFCAGFSATPSTVWFSDVGEPEGFEPDWSIEVRTNDSDVITTLKQYNSRLYIFKKNAFYELTGDNPDNFAIREISTEYGCLSNRAIEVFNDIMIFLDSKGVMRFNGANLECISTPVQPVFDTMNLAAADQATMVHDKTRNQIMIGIPVNGSTVNNMTVVYDYAANAWTKYEGYNPSVYTTVRQRFGTRTVLHGGYSGSVFYHGASLLGDNGAGFSCVLKTRFFSNGQSTEQQFRRLWINVDEVTGATSPLNINLYQDYGSSVIINRTMYQTPFQSRIDFGIPAKSLAFELGKFSATLSIKFHGFAIGYRYQRDV